MCVLYLFIHFRRFIRSLLLFEEGVSVRLADYENHTTLLLFEREWM